MSTRTPRSADRRARLLRSGALLLALAAVVLAVTARSAYVDGRSTTVVADFDSAVGLYVGSDVQVLGDMINIGTLSAFVLVSVAVPVLRKSRPDLERSFQVPGSPILPWLAALVSFYLMLNLPLDTWLRFLVWMALGFAIYFVYGYRSSRVGRAADAVDVADKV